MLLPSLSLVILFSTFTVTNSIFRTCKSDEDCPLNSNCNTEARVCRCNQGFIGGCNISATPLSEAIQTYTLNGSSLEYFYITPLQKNKFVQISLSICEEGELHPITLYFWGETGFQTQFSAANTFVPPLYREFIENCTLLTFPEFYFYTQRNGESERLIIGIQSDSEGLALSMAVSQKVSYAIYISYYVAVSVMVILLLSFFGSMFVAILRRRRVVPLPSRNTREEEENNIDYFQEYLPATKFQDAGIEKTECPICLQMLEEGQVVRRTPCDHTFHLSCLDSWCLKNVTCPVCRHDLTYEYVKALKDSLKVRATNSSKYMKDWQESIEMETVGRQVREEML